MNISPGSDLNQTAPIVEAGGSYRTFSYLIRGPVTLGIITAGVMLNAVSVVYIRRARSAISIYLVALGAWNTAVLLSALGMYSAPVLCYGYLPVSGVYVYVYRVVYMTSDMSLVASIWILMALVIDRYTALDRPLHHFTRSTNGGGTSRSVLRTVIAISILAVVHSMPRLFALTVDHRLVGNDTVPTIVISRFGRHRSYRLCYRIVGSLLTYSLIPYLLLLALLLPIISRMRHQFNERKISRSHNGVQLMIAARFTQRRRETQRKLQNDYMLLALLIKHLLMNLAPTVVDILEHTIGVEGFTGVLPNVLIDVSNLLVVTNASSNFFVYVTWSIGFRSALQRALLSYLFGMVPMVERNGPTAEQCHVPMDEYCSDTSTTTRSQSQAHSLTTTRSLQTPFAGVQRDLFNVRAQVHGQRSESTQRRLLLSPTDYRPRAHTAGGLM